MKSSCLIDNIILDLLKGGIDISSAKSHEVWKSRVDSHLYAILLCQGHGLSHHPRISSMESTGDIGGGDVGNHLFVKSQFVNAKTFPNIRVHVYLDLFGHHPSSNGLK